MQTVQNGNTIGYVYDIPGKTREIHVSRRANWARSNRPELLHSPKL